MNAMSFAAPSIKNSFLLGYVFHHGRPLGQKSRSLLRTGDMLPLGWTIDPDGNPIHGPQRGTRKKKGAMVMLGALKNSRL